MTFFRLITSPFLILIFGLTQWLAAQNPDTDTISSPTVKIQITTVTQARGANSDPKYKTSDSPSLSADREMKTSFTSTVFAGAEVLRNTEAYIDPEVSAGSGLSDTKGIAGFPNGEIYRVDTVSPKFNLFRLYVKHTVGFGDEKEEIAADQKQIQTHYRVNRISIVAGKFSLNDFFDLNAYSHDPRTQFLNWALMDNGAWDYAADTRGYTLGFMIEYNTRVIALRFASVMVPEEANQLSLDTNITHARGDNFELEYRYHLGAQTGKLRSLAYINHARMGSYVQSVDTTKPNKPEITATLSYRTKFGFGLNFEQSLTPNLGLFARLGWNDGRTETWAFTEIDSAASLGFAWKLFPAREDRLGFAIIYNEISPEHRNYLRLGGNGFIIGEGGLNYAPEEIFETYYAAKIWKPVTVTGDFQLVRNPAYNRDRSSLAVFALRLHYEL